MLVLLDCDQLEEVLARRRAWGSDKLDEVREGVPHLGQQVGRPASLQQQLALLLGGAADERRLVAVLGAYEPCPPSSGFVESGSHVRGDGAGTAALAVEIIDADHGEERLAALATDRITEVVLIDLGAHNVRWLALADGEYRPTDASRVIDLGPAKLAQRSIGRATPTARHRQVRARRPPCSLVVRVSPMEPLVGPFVHAARSGLRVPLAKGEEVQNQPAVPASRTEHEAEWALRWRTLTKRDIRLDETTEPGSICSLVVAPFKQAAADALGLECPALPFGRDPSGGPRVKTFDLLPPDARINQHRNAPSAAANLRHSLALAVGGQVPELLLELLGGEGAQPVPGKDLVCRHRDRRFQGDAAVFV